VVFYGAVEHVRGSPPHSRLAPRAPPECLTSPRLQRRTPQRSAGRAVAAAARAAPRTTGRTQARAHLPECSPRAPRPARIPWPPRPSQLAEAAA
jgi:hypothetical protein